MDEHRGLSRLKNFGDEERIIESNDESRGKRGLEFIISTRYSHTHTRARLHSLQFEKTFQVELKRFRRRQKGHGRI